MGALVGFLNRDGASADPALLERMTAALGARLQGAPPAWVQGPMALRGTVMHGVEQGAVALDGRLRPADDSMVLTAAGESAARLAWHAWSRGGAGATKDLEGTASWVLWSGERQELLCVRDRVGEKPLYVHRGSRRFAFASEIKALLALPGVSAEPDELRIADHLAVNMEDKRATFYRDVRRLPPGHQLSVTATREEEACYWALDPDRGSPAGSEEEAAERFRELFTECVSWCLDDAPHPGFLLSGGLDSSAIIGAARDLLPAGPAPPCLTVCFEGFPDADESEWARLALEGGGFTHELLEAGGLSPLAQREADLERAEEPVHVPNLFVYAAVARRARELGVRTLLDGLDGDTTVGHGLERLSELLRRLRWVAMLRETRWLARRLGASTGAFLARFALAPVIAPGLARLTGRERNPVPRVLHAGFAERSGWVEHHHEVMRGRTGPFRTLRTAHWRHLTSGMLTRYLEVNDLMASSLGLDNRHPYYDPRLMEFCLGLPARMRLHRGWDRRVQRLALEGLVPERIRWRTRKAWWGTFFEQRVIQDDGPRIEALLADPAGRLAPWVDLEATRSSWRRCRAGRYRERDLMDVWVVVTLALWLVRDA